MLWAASVGGIFLRLCVEALRRGLVPHRRAKREGGHLDVLDRSPCICRPSSIIYHECSAPLEFLVRIRSYVVKVLCTNSGLGYTITPQIYLYIGSQWMSTTKSTPPLPSPPNPPLSFPLARHL